MSEFKAQRDYHHRMAGYARADKRMADYRYHANLEMRAAAALSREPAARRDTNVPSDLWSDPCARGPEPLLDRG